MNTEFNNGLAGLDYSLDHVNDSIDEACAWAAFTRTNPTVALQSIRRRVMASELECSESEIEKTLVEAYSRYDAAAQDNLAFEKERDPKGIVGMSPVPPHDITPGAFLRTIYKNGQRIALYDGPQHKSLWTPVSVDASIPIHARQAVRFWPLPCCGNLTSRRTSNNVTSWNYAVVTSLSVTHLAELIANGLSVVACIATGSSYFDTRAILRLNGAIRNREEWMTERERVSPLLERHKTRIFRPETLIPLPGTISQHGIHRLLYFNPDASAVA